MNSETRPCAPGDVLASANVPCGAEYTIEVFEPEMHPDRGTTQCHDVIVALVVSVPSRDGGASILPSLRDDARTCLGEKLLYFWGFQSPDFSGFRRRIEERSGIAIAPMVSELTILGVEALASVQSVADAHRASVVAQESARATSYAAWPVRV